MQLYVNIDSREDTVFAEIIRAFKRKPVLTHHERDELVKKLMEGGVIPSDKYRKIETMAFDHVGFRYTLHSATWNMEFNDNDQPKRRRPIGGKISGRFAFDAIENGMYVQGMEVRYEADYNMNCPAIILSIYPYGH